MHITVIGAGIGGLAVSCLLSGEGHEVTVFEKNASPGGKMNEITAGGFRFDTGPSLLTMPFVLEKLFKKCGERLDDYLTIEPAAPLCRYHYPDGIVFDCYQDPEKSISEISQFAPGDTEAFRKFLDYTKTLYERTSESFLFNPLYSFSDIAQFNPLDFFKIDVHRTMSSRVDRSFTSSYMRQFFKRFATYLGSSPYHAPATLNVIPHVELSMGGWYVNGGMYRIAEALVQLAEKQGVTFHYEASVESILVEKGRAAGVVIEDGPRIRSEAVFTNADASETYLKLLNREAVSRRKKKRIKKMEPSSSGFVLLLGIDRKYDQLLHHNIFFSKDYRAEFEALFDRLEMPEDPTLYISDTSRTDPADAIPGGSNLFILANAPYLNEQHDWDSLQVQVERFILHKLEQQGLNGLENSIRFKHVITPEDFYEKYRSNRGSLYGTSSNSRLSAFLRPRNKSAEIKGLYLVGGSSHPGGGIPLVVLSTFHAVELMNRSL